MGLKDELGIVKAGALADLLLVDGNPLEDQSLLVGPAHFAMIMKDGAMFRDPRAARQGGRTAASPRASPSRSATLAARPRAAALARSSA